MAETGLHIPEAGGVLRIAVKAGDSFTCAFSPDTVIMDIRGEDLAFSTSAGGTLVLAGFVPAVTSGEVLLRFGEFAVSGADIYASLTANFNTDHAAADTPALTETTAALLSEMDAEPTRLGDILEASLRSPNATPAEPAGPPAFHEPTHSTAEALPSSTPLHSPADPADEVPAHLRLDIIG